MPQIRVTTKRAEQVWQSPDGQRTIYSVVLEYNGQQTTAKTYSRAIGSEGFSGEVETYEKQGKNGTETFVKQVQKEGGYQGGGGSRQPRDDSHIRAQWAIGQASIICEDHSMEAIEIVAKQFFAMVDRVKVGEPEQAGQLPVTQIGDGITLEDIPDIFAS